MSRKEACTIKAAPHAAPKLSPFDLGHAHGRFEHKDSPGRQAQTSSPKNSVQGMADAANAEGSGENATSAGDDDAEDSDGDSAEADEESSETEDPDAIAPPACATDEDGHQAGPAISIKHSSMTCAKGSKINQQTNSPQESSDDELYAGIDLISDSERDGSDMDHIEERAIVASEEHDDSHVTRSATNDELHGAQASSYADEDIWEGLDFHHRPLGDPSDFFDEQFSQTHLYNFLNSDDGNDFSGFPTDIGFTTDDPSKSPSLPSQRRVRFAEPPHSEIQGTVALFEDAKQESLCSSGTGLDDHSDADSKSSSGYECELLAVIGSRRSLTKYLSSRLWRDHRRGRYPCFRTA